MSGWRRGPLRPAGRLRCPSTGAVAAPANGPDQEELLALLGKHKMGKACLYIRKLADIDLAILERLIAGSFAEIMRRYPSHPSMGGF